jgi:hypothetical protein
VTQPELADGMWDEATRDLEAEAAEMQFATAKVKVADLSGFLFVAQSPAEFQARLAYAGADIQRAVDSVSPGDEALAHRVQASLAHDFQLLHTARAPQREAAARAARATAAVTAELARRLAKDDDDDHEHGDGCSCEDKDGKDDGKKGDSGSSGSGDGGSKPKSDGDDSKKSPPPFVKKDGPPSDSSGDDKPKDGPPPPPHKDSGPPAPPKADAGPPVPPGPDDIAPPAPGDVPPGVDPSAPIGADPAGAPAPPPDPQAVPAAGPQDDPTADPANCPVCGTPGHDGACGNPECPMFGQQFPTDPAQREDLKAQLGLGAGNTVPDPSPPVSGLPVAHARALRDRLSQVAAIRARAAEGQVPVGPAVLTDDDVDPDAEGGPVGVRAGTTVAVRGCDHDGTGRSWAVVRVAGRELYLDPAKLRPVAAARHTAPGGGPHAPYNVEQRGDQWVVVNDLGEVKGTHDTEDEAREQQKALYANVEGASEQAEQKHEGVYHPDQYGSARYENVSAPSRPDWVHDEWADQRDEPDPGESPYVGREQPDGDELKPTKWIEDAYESFPGRRASVTTTAGPYDPGGNPYAVQGPGMPGSVGDPEEIQDARRYQSAPDLPGDTLGYQQQNLPAPADDLAGGLAQRTPPAGQAMGATGARGVLRDQAAYSAPAPVRRMAAEAMAANPDLSPDRAMDLALEAARRFPGVLGQEGRR